jgi:hypothetical protein
VQNGVRLAPFCTIFAFCGAERCGTEIYMPDRPSIGVIFFATFRQCTDNVSRLKSVEYRFYPYVFAVAYNVTWET